MAWQPLADQKAASLATDISKNCSWRLGNRGLSAQLVWHQNELQVSGCSGTCCGIITPSANLGSLGGTRMLCGVSRHYRNLRIRATKIILHSSSGEPYGTSRLPHAAFYTLQVEMLLPHSAEQPCQAGQHHGRLPAAPVRFTECAGQSYHSQKFKVLALVSLALSIYELAQGPRVTTLGQMVSAHRKAERETNRS